MPWGWNEPCARRRGASKWSRRRWTLHVPDSSRVRCDNESVGERTKHMKYGTPYGVG